MKTLAKITWTLKEQDKKPKRAELSMEGAGSFLLGGLVDIFRYAVQEISRQTSGSPKVVKEAIFTLINSQQEENNE